VIGHREKNIVAIEPMISGIITIRVLNHIFDLKRNIYGRKPVLLTELMVSRPPVKKRIIPLTAANSYPNVLDKGRFTMMRFRIIRADRTNSAGKYALNFPG